MSAWQITRDGDRLALEGSLRLEDARAIWRALREHVRAPGAHLDLDLAHVTDIDGGTMALLVETRRDLAAAGTRCELLRAPADIAPIVHLYGGDEAPEPRPAAHRERRGAIERVGATTHHLLEVARRPPTFVGALVEALGLSTKKPGRASWQTVPRLLARAGTDGIPIVVLLNFLVGFVMVYQSKPQLELFGANIWAADLVGISSTRELAPLMTAIILAGRSGAAYAAELGTMRVSEEIDAMRTMGLAPVPHLVLPRVTALAIAAPILALLGDVAAILGGLVVSVTSLDLTPSGYFAELRSALVFADVWTGLVKALVFGIAIALIGCQQGLLTRGAAAGVGRSTTSTVVTCLFVIVILDTLLTVVFRAVGT